MELVSTAEVFDMEFESTVAAGDEYKKGYAAGYADGFDDGMKEPDQIGELSKYTKIIAKPQSTTSFTIENPLGGIAKKVSVIMTPYQLTSKRKCRKYVADYNMGIAVGEYSDTGSSALYCSQLTTGTLENGRFKITEGKIILYRYNSANTWDDGSEYEVEIYE